MDITAPTPSDLGSPLVRKALDDVRKYVVLFGALSAIVFGTVAVAAFTHHRATPFMWVRGGVLLAFAPLLHRYATRAAAGCRRAFDRVRTLSAVMPVAVVGVDLVPGLCPAWYTVLQGLSALALAAVALLTRGAALSAAFPRR